LIFLEYPYYLVYLSRDFGLSIFWYRSKITERSHCHSSIVPLSSCKNRLVWVCCFRRVRFNYFFLFVCLVSCNGNVNTSISICVNCSWVIGTAVGGEVYNWSVGKGASIASASDNDRPPIDRNGGGEMPAKYTEKNSLSLSRTVFFFLLCCVCCFGGLFSVPRSLKHKQHARACDLNIPMY